MAKYRKVQYVEDGVDEFQCLNCKSVFAVRYGDIKFCMTCGEPLSLHNCRPHSIPRWAWDLWGHNAFDHDLYRPRKRLLPNWEIQVRSKWPNSPWGDWRYEWRAEEYSAIGIMSVLNSKKRAADSVDDDGEDCIVQFEYRAIVVK